MNIFWLKSKRSHFIFCNDNLLFGLFYSMKMQISLILLICFMLGAILALYLCFVKEKACKIH